MARRPRRGPKAISPWPFVGMAGMACVFFLYAASGLLAPWWAVVAAAGLWALALFVATALVVTAPDLGAVDPGRARGVLVRRAERRRGVARVDGL